VLNLNFKGGQSDPAPPESRKRKLTALEELKEVRTRREMLRR
jgi:hypothetical protein